MNRKQVIQKLDDGEQIVCSVGNRYQYKYHIGNETVNYRTVQSLVNDNIVDSRYVYDKNNGTLSYIYYFKKTEKEI